MNEDERTPIGEVYGEVYIDKTTGDIMNVKGKKDWEKEFNEKFPPINVTKHGGGTFVQLNKELEKEHEKIKSFIAKHLSRAIAKERTQLLKEVREKILNESMLELLINPVYIIVRLALEDRLKELEERK